MKTRQSMALGCIFTLVLCGENSEATLSAPNAMVVAQSGLRLRATPAMDASISGGLAFGQAVQVLTRAEPAVSIEGNRGHWARVMTEDGQTGWAFDYYLYPYDPDDVRTYNPAGTYYYMTDQLCASREYGDIPCPTLVFDASDRLVGAFARGVQHEWDGDDRVLASYLVGECTGGAAATYSYSVDSRELTRLWMHSYQHPDCGVVDESEEVGYDIHVLCLRDLCTYIEQDRRNQEIRSYTPRPGEYVAERGELVDARAYEEDFEVVQDRQLRRVSVDGLLYDISPDHRFTPVP